MLDSKSMRKRFTVVDLYSGVGGFAIGFINASKHSRMISFEIRLLADLDSTAAFTFKKNYPHIPFAVTDLRCASADDILRLGRLKRGELDFLIGGPPCQGFSPSGKRSLKDQRNNLLRHFVQIALDVQPRVVVIENVPHVVNLWERLFGCGIADSFPGYRVGCDIVNASAFGVPQIRRRAFIVACREDSGIARVHFPNGTHDAVDIVSKSYRKAHSNLNFTSVEEAIGDLPSIKAGHGIDGGQYTSPAMTDYQRARRTGSVCLFNHVARFHSKLFLKKISVIRPGRSNTDLPAGKKFSSNYYSQAYGRLHANGIASTITANFRNPGSGRFTHYRDRRSITVREAARLQSFDDSFIFYGYETEQERHVGNAVPTLMAKALAMHFGKLLRAALRCQS